MKCSLNFHMNPCQCDICRNTLQILGHCVDSRSFVGSEKSDHDTPAHGIKIESDRHQIHSHSLSVH